MCKTDFAVELAESIDAMANLNRSIMVKIAGDKKYRLIYNSLLCVANCMNSALVKAYAIANEEVNHENAE